MEETLYSYTWGDLSFAYNQFAQGQPAGAQTDSWMDLTPEQQAAYGYLATDILRRGTARIHEAIIEAMAEPDPAAAEHCRECGVRVPGRRQPRPAPDTLRSPPICDNCAGPGA